MKALLVLIFSFYLLNSNTNKRYKRNPLKKPNQLQFSGWSSTTTAVYNATQTGQKTYVPKSFKGILKRFGLLHLMTPSGIHLSSLLMFVFIFIKKKYRIAIYLPLIIIFYPMIGLYSLKRVLYFYLFKLFIKDNQTCFIITFLFDLLIGGYSNSPLSFSYSFLCWGLIVFSNSKFKMALNLFTAQLLISYFTIEQINSLAIIINPIFTTIFSFFFPFMSINYWVIEIDLALRAINFFLSLFITSLYLIDKYLFFLNFHPNIMLIILISIYNLRYSKKILATLLVISCGNLNDTHSTYKNRKEGLKSIGIGEKEDLLKTEKDSLYFFDRTCRRKFKSSYWEVKCKKKALHLGGPFI